MTDSYDWETVEVPAGAFIGWGTAGGQHVTGKVLDYSPTNGNDFDGNPCPLITVELAASAASFNKAGERTNYPAGDLVNVTCGQAGLKAAVQRAAINVGDMIKITMSGVIKTNKGNDMKQFELKIARGSGQAQAPTQVQAAAPEPPF